MVATHVLPVHAHGSAEDLVIMGQSEISFFSLCSCVVGRREKLLLAIAYNSRWRL